MLRMSLWRLNSRKAFLQGFTGIVPFLSGLLVLRRSARPVPFCGICVFFWRTAGPFCPSLHISIPVASCNHRAQAWRCPLHFWAQQLWRQASPAFQVAVLSVQGPSPQESLSVVLSPWGSWAGCRSSWAEPALPAPLRSPGCLAHRVLGPLSSLETRILQFWKFSGITLVISFPPFYLYIIVLMQICLV